MFSSQYKKGEKCLVPVQPFSVIWILHVPSVSTFLPVPVALVFQGWH